MEAFNAIKEILASIPDDELPESSRIEHRDDGKVVVWFGGRGSYLGTAKTRAKRDPLTYRENGASEALFGEALYRMDRRFLENGDSLDGLTLSKPPTMRIDFAASGKAILDVEGSAGE